MSQTSKGPAPWGIWSSNGTANSAHTKMTSQSSTANDATGTISSKQKHKEPWNPALPTPPTSAPAATNTNVPQGLGFDGATSVTDTQDEVLSSSPQNGRRGNSPDIVRSNSPFLYRQRQATAAQAAALHHSPKDAFHESRNTYGFADENAGRHPGQRLKTVLQSTIEDDGYPSSLTGPARSSSTPPFANAHPGQNFTPSTNAPFFTPQVPQRGFYEGSREPDLGATLRNLSISDSVASRFESNGSRSNSPYIHNTMPGSPFMHQQQQHQQHQQPQPDYSQYSDYSSGYNRSQYEDDYARLSPSGYPPQEPVYGNYAYGYRGGSMRDVYRGNDMNRSGYDRSRFAQDRRPMPFASNDYYRGPQANSYQQNSPYYENRGAPSPYASPAPRRDDTGAGLRSPMLEEFRNNKAKKYEIRDIVGHVVEFSGDQHGSRFIQQKLETANSDDKEEIFQEMLPNCLQLMTDVFGNYVIQKFFEHGNQVQKTILAKHMETHVLSLSLQMYGCRVVQKALEHILAEQQVHMVRELDGFVLKCVKDQNGNHVIQKALERVPAEKIQFIITAFHGQAYSLATHPYGCRVIQRMLEYCPEAQVTLLEELHRYTQNLIVDQYGNYVSQHIIERGNPADRSKVIDIVRGQVLALSKHKFASNVVEKCIAFGSQAERHDLIEEALVPGIDGQSGISSLMKDQYGNYVLQKMLEVGDDAQRIELAQKIKPLLETLKKFSYGKHLASIERLLELQA